MTIVSCPSMHRAARNLLFREWHWNGYLPFEAGLPGRAITSALAAVGRSSASRESARRTGVAVFDSVAGGDAHQGSDVDLVVDFARAPSDCGRRAPSSSDGGRRQPRPRHSSSLSTPRSSSPYWPAAAPSAPEPTGHGGRCRCGSSPPHRGSGECPPTSSPTAPCASARQPRRYGDGHRVGPRLEAAIRSEDLTVQLEELPEDVLPPEVVPPEVVPPVEVPPVEVPPDDVPA